MKFTAATVSAAALLLVSSSTTNSHVQAFGVSPSFVRTTTSRSLSLGVQKHQHHSSSSLFSSSSRTTRSSVSSLQMTYSVGIVGATGAVGKEIRQCLTTRKFPMSSLRIFGSERSAGKTIDGIKVELFDVDKARECDVVFLAVSGDFSLEYAKALSENDGCVVIDNSVREKVKQTKQNNSQTNPVICVRYM